MTALTMLRELIDALMDDDYETAIVHGKDLVAALDEEGCPNQKALVRMLKSASKHYVEYIEEEAEIEDLDFDREEDNDPEDDITSELDFNF